jgi:hypothetical protein
MDRTELLGAVLEKLEAVVILLTVAGEQKLAACTESLAQQVKSGAEEETEPPASSLH